MHSVLMFSTFLAVHRSDQTHYFNGNEFGALISYFAVIEKVGVYGWGLDLIFG
jgi:hypothetical protein